MPDTTNSPQAPVLLDLYRPALLPRISVRLQVLLRRAKEHQQAIDRKIFELVPSGRHGNVARWMGENAQIVHDEKFRMKICLDQLENLVRLHSETTIKDEVEMLRMQYQLFGRILGEAHPDNGPCTNGAQDKSG